MSVNLAKLHRNSKGFTHILLIALLFAGVAGVGGLVYWRVSSYNNHSKDTGKTTTASDGTKTNSATISDECVAKTHDENICRMGAISDLSKYSSEVHMKTETMDARIKFDGKGNTDTNIGGDTKGISFGGKYYIYFNNAWYDSGNDASQSPKDPIPSLGFATTAGIKYENLGKEPCGKDTCFRYRMSGGILTDGVVVCLFGDKDFLPRYYDSKGGLLGTMTMTIDYKPITIAAPAGAKPISSLTSDLQ